MLIEAAGLTRVFRTFGRRAGVAGALRDLLRVGGEDKVAVDRIDLHVDSGELVGVIGPNGAGKSTTIKMLTGVLRPTSGTLRVAGREPWRERRAHVREIGVVFGQRTQLWWDLAVVEAFDLLASIYQVPLDDYRKRLRHFDEILEIGPLLAVPVRELSLGQRMRCEVAASLLHRPKLLLLDEPSIGLDVVAKQRIRDSIRSMAQDENVGVLLTSHDAGDLEALCKRVIIINHGQIVYEDRVSNLKRRFLTSKLVEVRYADELPKDFTLDGMDVLKVGRYGVKLRFDTNQTPADKVLAMLSAYGQVMDINISDPPLEEVIAKIYETNE